MSMTEQSAEDRKIVLLAASARARTGAAQGACLRDTDGRTYAGCSVDLPDLRLSGIQLVVAMAVASGAAGVEAVAVAGADASDVDLALLRERACPLLWCADERGTAAESVTL